MRTNPEKQFLSNSTMNKKIVSTLPVIILVGLITGSAIAAEVVKVIPRPANVKSADGVFTLTGETIIVAGSPELTGMARYLADLLAPATGLKLAVQSAGPAEAGIVLRLDAAANRLGDEGYTLVCSPKGVTITGARPAGVFYGVQTLRQLLPVEVEQRGKVEGVAWTVPCVSIEDRPRFKWRGYLLDPARHFRPKEEIKRYIDLLAFQKLNVLQLHLTDDQGWRVEIKKYPKLVEVGSRVPNHSRKTGEGWFYSQEDVKELVAYAASRYVTIVPEIEMPGHSGAAIASYPELACGGKHPGGWSAPLCVSQDAVLRFAKDVLDEVVAIFPSPYIHVGADEVPVGPWRGCPQCKAATDKLAGEKLPVDVVPFRIKQAAAGLPYHEDIGRLQGEFVREIDQHLASKGRRMVGWDEILEGGLKTSSPAVVMAWRSATAVAGATGRRRDVIVSIYPDYYLDNDTPLQRTYGQEPVPANLPAGEEAHVLGVQANMWGEGTPTIEQVDMRSFPRLCALSEVAWTPREARNFEDFSARLKLFRVRLELLGVRMKE